VEDDNNSGENGDEVKDLPKKKETKLGGLNKLDKNMMSGYGIMNTCKSLSYAYLSSTRVFSSTLKSSV